ncbi:tryptophan synthase subunit alpha [Saccharopolyspora hattusasensis]|uniref:tryptophan synthase subunit alpha n=1 Tax=Saccharopolyspora hattusasensis TaxID=1128679 RepID=UPI003D98E52F
MYSHAHTVGSTLRHQEPPEAYRQPTEGTISYARADTFALDTSQYTDVEAARALAHRVRLGGVVNRWPATSPDPAPSRALSDLFTSCRRQQRAALIGYLPAGYPTMARCRAALHAMVSSGVDLVEIGLPYPTRLDGPTVRAATQAASAGGATVQQVWELVEAVSAAGGKAMVMGCWGPIQQYGPAEFARDLASAGGLGAITPDLLPGTHPEQIWRQHTDDYGLERTYLACPGDSDAAVVAAADASTSWVYAATGHRTGGAAPGAQHAHALVKQLRAFTELPIGLGFGIRTGAHAAAMARHAEAVIVGSVLVEAASHGPSEVAGLTTALVHGLRRRELATAGSSQEHETHADSLPQQRSRTAPA